MLKIVINSQKGGSGKTNLCAHLSVEAERTGDGPVYLIDTDPQRTLSTWHEARDAEAPRRVEVVLSNLAAALTTLEQQHGAALCMVDTAPTRGEETTELFRLADLVLVPVRPSPSDLWAVSATVAALKRCSTPFLFIVNQATINANITAQAIASLSHHGPVAETIVVSRVHYAAAMTDGHTAPELAIKGQPAQEITRLWQNVRSCLHARMQAIKVPTHAEARRPNQRAAGRNSPRGSRATT